MTCLMLLFIKNLNIIWKIRQRFFETLTSLCLLWNIIFARKPHTKFETPSLATAEPVRINCWRARHLARSCENQASAKRLVLSALKNIAFAWRIHAKIHGIECWHSLRIEFYKPQLVLLLLLSTNLNFDQSLRPLQINQLLYHIFLAFHVSIQIQCDAGTYFIHVKKSMTPSNIRCGS